MEVSDVIKMVFFHLWGPAGTGFTLRSAVCHPVNHHRIIPLDWMSSAPPTGLPQKHRGTLHESCPVINSDTPRP